MEEITLEALDTGQFIERQVAEIKRDAGEETAVSALSGGVDSAVVTLLAHRELTARAPESLVHLLERKRLTLKILYSGYIVAHKVKEKRDNLRLLSLSCRSYVLSRLEI